MYRTIEASNINQPSVSGAEILQGQQLAFSTFIHTDVARAVGAIPPWVTSFPSEATEERSYDTAQVYFDTDQLRTVTEISDSKEPNIKLYQVTQFRPNPDSNPDLYYDASREPHMRAYDTRYAPFLPTTQITIKEWPTRSRGTLRYPTAIRYFDRLGDGVRELRLSADRSQPIGLFYQSLNAAESVKASVQLKGSETGALREIEIEGRASAMGFKPPFAHAEGKAEIGEHEIKRLLLGEPLDERWEYDRERGLIRFYLTSEHFDTTDTRNPWFVEFRINYPEITALSEHIDAFTATPNDNLGEALFTALDFLTAEPFATNAFISAAYDSHGDSDRMFII